VNRETRGQGCRRSGSNFTLGARKSRVGGEMAIGSQFNPFLISSSTKGALLCMQTHVGEWFRRTYKTFVSTARTKLKEKL
jgi:hypothetical protein